jgi:hypothetical protein
VEMLVVEMSRTNRAVAARHFMKIPPELFPEDPSSRIWIMNRIGT